MIYWERLPVWVHKGMGESTGESGKKTTWMWFRQTSVEPASARLHRGVWRGLCFWWIPVPGKGVGTGQPLFTHLLGEECTLPGYPCIYSGKAVPQAVVCMWEGCTESTMGAHRITALLCVLWTLSFKMQLKELKEVSESLPNHTVIKVRGWIWTIFNS